MKVNKFKIYGFLPLLVGGLLTTSLLEIKTSVNVEKINGITNRQVVNRNDVYPQKGELGYAWWDTRQDTETSIWMKAAKNSADSWYLIEWRVRYYDKETHSKPGDADFDNRVYDCVQTTGTDSSNNTYFGFRSSGNCSWIPPNSKRYTQWINAQAHGRNQSGTITTTVKSDPMFSFKTPDRTYSDEFVLESAHVTNIGETTADVSIRLDPADEADYIDVMEISFVDEANDYVSEVVATPREDGAGDGTVIVEATLDDLNPDTNYNISVVSNTKAVANDIFTFTTNPWVEKIITLNGNRGILKSNTDSVTIGYNVHSLWPNYSSEKIYVELRTHTGSIYDSWIYDSSDSTIIDDKELTKLAPNITYSGWTLNVYSYKTGTFLESHTLGDFKLAQ